MDSTGVRQVELARLEGGQCAQYGLRVFLMQKMSYVGQHVEGHGLGKELLEISEEGGANPAIHGTGHEGGFRVYLGENKSLSLPPPLESPRPTGQ